MQTLSYTVGQWRADAQLEELETGKLMAIISVRDGKQALREQSRHTIVFDHEAGMDKKHETEILINKILKSRYGV
jgi:hypothetical protein